MPDDGNKSKNQIQMSKKKWENPWLRQPKVASPGCNQQHNSQKLKGNTWQMREPQQGQVTLHPSLEDKDTVHVHCQFK